jgi:hypothetical protein
MSLASSAAIVVLPEPLFPTTDTRCMRSSMPNLVTGCECAQR